MKLKYRKSIEIYFVLYLAALIFLLPSPEDDKNKPDGNNSKVSHIPFTIQPEKTTLNCNLSLDSSGVKILSIDSVNTVIYFGDVENVEYEFTIEDPLLKQKLYLKNNGDTSNHYFRFIENKDLQSAQFFWAPPIFDKLNKTYNVIVTAYGKIKEDKADKPELYEPERIIKAQTKFSLNMIYVNTELAVNAQNLQQNQNNGNINQNQIPISFQPSGPIELRPEQGFIQAQAYKKWTNIMYAYGGAFGNDLIDYKVQVIAEKEDMGGSAVIGNVEPNRIYISGTTPAYGKLKVEFSVISRFNKKEYKKDFFIVPVKFLEPIYERVMYPEKTYTIDPRIPLKYGQDVKTMIKDGQSVRVQSEQGSSFQFTPDISDTNKIFSLESYIDGNLIGQKYKITILDYSNPIIKDIQYVGKGEVNIITHTYGFINRKENFSKIEIEGNGRVRELLGKTPDSPDNITHVQIFRCTPRNQSQPFSFRIYAIDSRGYKSAVKNYNEE